MFNKKKILVFLSVLLIILAFPVSLVLRELYNLTDTMGIAIPSFILGIGIGILVSTIFIPGKKSTNAKKGDNSKGENTTNLNSTSI